MVGETPSKIADSAFPIARNVRHLPYMIEHMTARKEQYDDEADSSPEVSILDNGEYVRRSYAQKGHEPKHRCGDSDYTEIVQRAID